MVAKAGIEPALLYRKRILSPQRLPIPPLGLFKFITTAIYKTYYNKSSIIQKIFQFQQ